MTRPGRRPASVLVIALAALLFGGASAAAAPAAHGETTARSSVADVIARTNAIRKEAGCSPVKADEKLRSVAQKHAVDMSRNGYLEHEDSDGRTSGQRIRTTGGHDVTGENLAYGYPSAAEVMKVWMDSSGHRRNIEDCAFTHVGVGYAPGGHYWVQDFAG
jgi:uncharacterized protein YkwD